MPLKTPQFVKNGGGGGLEYGSMLSYLVVLSILFTLTTSRHSFFLMGKKALLAYRVSQGNFKFVE